MANYYGQTLNNSDFYLQREGIIDANEPFETIFLAEDEIEKFIEKYMLENPGTEIETRFVNHAPVELKQEIEIRYLRPPTPDLPPIIIKEVPVIEKEEAPLKIIQRAKREEERKEPIVIRERPNLLPPPELKTIYVENVIKREKLNDARFERVLTENQNRLLNNESSRLEFDEQARVEKNGSREQRISFEEHASIIDYEEEFEHDRSTFEDSSDEHYKRKSYEKISEQDAELRSYEERLKDTLYEEYLLKLEKEEIEKKLTRSGVFRERIRERSNSHRSQSSVFQSRTRSSNSKIYDEKQFLRDQQLNEEEIRRKFLREEEERRIRQVHEEEMRYREAERLRIIREEELKRQRFEEERIREEQFRRQQQQQVKSTYYTNQASTVTSDANIKFTTVTDENELRRYNEILSNPNAPTIKTAADVERLSAAFSNISTATNTTIENAQSNSNAYYSGVQNNNSNYSESASSRQTSNDYFLAKSNSKSNLKSSISDLSRSNSGLVRQRITSITSYYNSSYPANTISETKTVTVNNY